MTLKFDTLTSLKVIQFIIYAQCDTTRLMTKSRHPVGNDCEAYVIHFWLVSMALRTVPPLTPEFTFALIFHDLFLTLRAVNVDEL